MQYMDVFCLQLALAVCDQVTRERTSTVLELLQATGTVMIVILGVRGASTCIILTHGLLVPQETRHLSLEQKLFRKTGTTYCFVNCSNMVLTGVLPTSFYKTHKLDCNLYTL